MFLGQPVRLQAQHRTCWRFSVAVIDRGEGRKRGGREVGRNQRGREKQAGKRQDGLEAGHRVRPCRQKVKFQYWSQKVDRDPTQQGQKQI